MKVLTESMVDKYFAFLGSRRLELAIWALLVFVAGWLLGYLQFRFQGF